MTTQAGFTLLQVMDVLWGSCTLKPGLHNSVWALSVLCCWHTLMAFNQLNQPWGMLENACRVFWGHAACLLVCQAQCNCMVACGALSAWTAYLCTC